MLSFNYRVIVTDDDEPQFEICGVWSNPLPIRYSKESVKSVDLEGLKDLMYRMNEAFNREFLYGGDKFPEIFNYDEFIKQQKE